MLRDDLEIALNDLILALRETADAYGTAAEIVDAAEGAALFADARDAYRRHAKQFEAEQRRLGHLPKEPDAEIGLLHEAASHVKASLAEDGLAALLEERKADEERIQDCAAALLALELSDDLRRAATQVKAQAADQAAKLTRLATTAPEKKS